MTDKGIKGLIAEIEADDEVGKLIWNQRIRPIKASFAAPRKKLPEELERALREAGIKKLFSHQADALEAVRAGQNVVLMTPTASGKSLVYNLPILEAILSDSKTRALYISPLKGLANDQIGTLRDFSASLDIDNLAELYDGDTPQSDRRRIKEEPPSIIYSNPDMLHMGILPYHKSWEHFFKNLKFVVIDEVHSYRGVFGSHVAHVLRRLRRVAAHYGAEIQFICCSATIANSKELAETLTGVDFKLIEKNGAPSSKKNFCFYEPTESPYTAATKIFAASVKAGFKTIAFTKARKITELMGRWVKDRAPELTDSISTYRAGFLPEERREIERKLFTGELTGVISTSALELGIDVGGLDVCVLVGYPGTVSSTWQRAGRVGRGSAESLVVMVAIEDALDHFFLRNPEDFFRRSSEAAVTDVTNHPIKKAHLECAVSEVKLSIDDEVYDVEESMGLLKELEDEEKLRFWAKGDIWYPRKRYPQREVNLRSGGETYRIVDEAGKLIGYSSSGRVLKELHPGALYLHQGTQYRVLTLDMKRRRAICRAVNLAIYTAAETNEEVEIVESLETKQAGGVELNWGAVQVTESVTGYWEKDIYSRETLKYYPLKLPDEIFETKAVWMKVDEELLEEIKEAEFGPAGSLHALEHAQIAALPLFAICDRMDLGGVSYSDYADLEGPAIFVYDGSEGGIGLTKRGFEVATDWFAATRLLMSECPCDVSCPSCTQDPKCGNANDPLDKRGALLILDRWLKG